MGAATGGGATGTGAAIAGAASGNAAATGAAGSTTASIASAAGSSLGGAASIFAASSGELGGTGSEPLKGLGDALAGPESSGESSLMPKGFILVLRQYRAPLHHRGAFLLNAEFGFIPDQTIKQRKHAKRASTGPWARDHRRERRDAVLAAAPGGGSADSAISSRHRPAPRQNRSRPLRI